MEQPEVQTLRDLQEEVSILRSLQEHMGYKRLMEIASVQMQRRMLEFMAPCLSQEGMIKQEYNKGVIAGLKIMTEMVEHHMSTLQSLLKQAERDEENDDEPDSDDVG